LGNRCNAELESKDYIRAVQSMYRSGDLRAPWGQLGQEPSSGERDYMYVPQVKQVPIAHVCTRSI